MKKYLALMLTLVMLVTSVPFSAFADSTVIGSSSSISTAWRPGTAGISTSKIWRISLVKETWNKELPKNKDLIPDLEQKVLSLVSNHMPSLMNSVVFYPSGRDISDDKLGWYDSASGNMIYVDGSPADIAYKYRAYSL